VLFHLARSPAFPSALSLLLYHPRAHYRALYGTPLRPTDQAVAYAKEWAIGRWRRRPDAQAIFALDEELAHRWNKSAGARAYWLPEPPVACLSEDEQPASRQGCVLYGALARRKGLALLTRALTMQPTHLRLVLAGVVDPPEYLTELEQHVAALRAAGVVVDVRARQHSELEGLQVLASANCALLPYPRHSGMSRVLVEACAMGTPVVTDNFGLLGHLVRRHRLGMTVDCANPSALREAVLSLADPERSATYAASLQEFAARFSPERFRSALVRGLGLASAEPSGSHGIDAQRVLK
jgi:Glycosyl transferases group 1